MRALKTSAVAGVIEALLMVALVAVVLSMVQLIYIPDIMEQREAEHMDEVSNQFSYLKSMTDIQTVTEADAPMFTMITLGCEKLPYFVTVSSYGEVQIIEDGETKIVADEGQPTEQSMTINSLEYTAENIYFVRQTYALEGGGIFVKQPTGNSTVRADPPVYIIDKTVPDIVEIYFNLTKYVSYKNRSHLSGLSKCFIRTNYSHTEQIIDDYEVVWDIKIYTAYPHAWQDSLNDTIGDYVDVSLTTDGESDEFIVLIESTEKPIHLFASETVIYTQIGHGWIK